MIRAQWAITFVLSVLPGFRVSTASAELIAAIHYVPGQPGEYLSLLDTADLANPISRAQIMGQVPFAIDFRPATGELYGVADGVILRLGLDGAVTELTGGTPFVLVQEDHLAMTFEPEADLLRVVSNGDHFLLDPNAGTAGVVATYPPLRYSDGGFAEQLYGVAYRMTAAMPSVLYGADYRSIITIDPVNAGIQASAATLGGDAAGVSVQAFDISPTSGTAYITTSFFVNPDHSPEVHSTVFSVDLATGIATRLPADFPFQIRQIAVVPEPAAMIPLAAVTGLMLRRGFTKRNRI